MHRGRTPRSVPDPVAGTAEWNVFGTVHGAHVPFFAAVWDEKLREELVASENVTRGLEARLSDELPRFGGPLVEDEVFASKPEENRT
jgi:hypothetical protein